MTAPQGTCAPGVLLCLALTLSSAPGALAVPDDGSAGTPAATVSVDATAGSSVPAPNASPPTEPPPPTEAGRGERSFERVATYPIHANRPSGTALDAATVAEIAAVSEDGRTLVYTDSEAQRIGLLDIGDPAAPRGLGTVSLTADALTADAPGAGAGAVSHAPATSPVEPTPVTEPTSPTEPTSVTVVGGHALVAVNTSTGFATPSGRLDVIDLATRHRVRSIALAGQPDSVAASRDHRYVAIAVENERDEEAAPEGLAAGSLPQAPPGLLQIVDLPSGDPESWSLRTVPLTAPDGTALPVLAEAGITEPTDPEPEYVSVNSENQIALTLQENNGVVIVDAASGEIRSAFSAGTTTVEEVDTVTDGLVSLDGTITDLPREPDAVAWLDAHHLATADEGDWRGGTRGWTVFDARTGAVVWEAGNSFEHAAVRHGLHDDTASADKGSEPEGLVVAEFDGVPHAFVASEPFGAVAVYDVSTPTAPRLTRCWPRRADRRACCPSPPAACSRCAARARWRRWGCVRPCRSSPGGCGRRPSRRWCPPTARTGHRSRGEPREPWPRVRASPGSS